MITTPTVSVSLTVGSRRMDATITHSPFTVGRLPEADLTLDDPSVSRRHAEIRYEDGAFILVDMGSRHGTYLNSRKIERLTLKPQDEVRFGGTDGPVLLFLGGDGHASASTVRSLISRIDAANDPVSSIEKLNWYLEAARKLNDVGAVDQILAALVETTLELTRVERGYVMLRDPQTAALRLVAGRANDGAILTDDSTISHSAIRRAIESADPFIVTDTLKSKIVTRSESVVAQNIRTVICMPLRSRRLADAGSGKVLGVLYLDNRLSPGKLAQIDNDLLKTIAAEAAALVENAQLILEEEQSRRYREELKIAAGIQQGLMPAHPPATSFASISARYEPCKEIGGDFYDAVAGEDSLSLVLADVSGKGVSAALLAQTLQGMVYAELLGNRPLDEIAHALNLYICARAISKYATLVILRLHRDGTLEYVNCGHVHPLLKTPKGIQRLSESEMPVGLIHDAHYRAHTVHLEPGTRLLLLSDGVTEAENESGEFFGDERLEESLARSSDLEDIFQSLSGYCGCASASDDCTMVEIDFSPAEGT
ncbi:MAG: SpoIIE family protein phosphatase [Terracidiphilus sp.]